MSDVTRGESSVVTDVPDYAAHERGEAVAGSGACGHHLVV
jgi:hypothetical protein